jgi:small subunit ribosomal protein S20
MRSAIKELRTALAEGDAKSAQALLPRTLQLIDATAQKGVIHRNTAARYKSRLSKAVQVAAG